MKNRNRLVETYFRTTCGSLFGIGSRLLILTCVWSAYIAFCPRAAGIEMTTETVWVPMRDGVQLATDVHRDPSWVKAPVVLIRTPYNKDRARGVAKRCVDAGYVVVIQDCRGAYASEGDLIPYNTEGQDGYDTFEWIVNQPWCNGRIGTWGGSYVGGVQWQAAVEDPPGLVTLAPRATWSNFYRNLYLGGVPRMLIVKWAAGNADRPEGAVPADGWDDIFMHLPVSTLDQKIGWSIPWLRGVFTHPEPDGYWTRTNLSDRITDLELPILHVVGYYDFFSRETVGNFVRMREHARDQATRTRQQLILGPWDHGSIGKSRVGEVDFGPEAVMDVDAENIAWFDRFLKGDGADSGPVVPPVRYFVMGDNRWSEADTWPPDGFKPTTFYLRSGGRANTRHGDGRLEKTPPTSAEPADLFQADPMDPAPACPVTPERKLSDATWAPVDQRPIEERQDVLVYKTEPLSRPLIFAGNAEAKLFVSADTPDADWVVRLVDVHPDGFAQNLVIGAIRGRYRDSELQPKLMTPGEIYEVRLDLGPVAATIQKGHRLQVDICGAYFPLLGRNTNTGEGPSGSAVKTATERVYHQPGYLSQIILPCRP